MSTILKCCCEVRGSAEETVDHHILCFASCLLSFSFDMLKKWQHSEDKDWTEMAKIRRLDAAEIRQKRNQVTIES